MTKSIPRPISSAAVTLVIELSLPNTAAANPKVSTSPQSSGTKA